jgi:hypothetical protein
MFRSIESYTHHDKLCQEYSRNPSLNDNTYLTRLTCPRPFLFLPWLRLFTVISISNLCSVEWQKKQKENERVSHILRWKCSWMETGGWKGGTSNRQDRPKKKHASNIQYVELSLSLFLSIESIDYQMMMCTVHHIYRIIRNTSIHYDDGGEDSSYISQIDGDVISILHTSCSFEIRHYLSCLSLSLER